MALDNSDIQIVSQLIYEYLLNIPTTVSVVRDRSAELPAGDNLRVDDFRTDIAIFDIADNSTADITYQDLDDAEWVLDLAKRKGWAFKLPDSMILEKFYDVLNDGARQAANKLANQLDSDLLVAHGATADSAFVTSGAGQNSWTLTYKHTGTADTTKWGTPAARLRLVQQLITMSTAAKRANWTPGATYYMLVPPEIIEQFITYLVVDKAIMGTGQLNDVAYVNAVIGQTLGFMPIMNNNITGDASTAGTGQFPCHFGIMNDTLHFALQYNMAETLRSPGFYGELIRGANRYGAKVRENARRMRLLFDFEA